MNQARPGSEAGDRFALGGRWSAGRYLRAGATLAAVGILGILGILVIGGVLMLAVIASALLWLGLRLSQRRSPLFRPTDGPRTGPVIEASYRVVEDHGRDASSGS